MWRESLQKPCWLTLDTYDTVFTTGSKKNTADIRGYDSYAHTSQKWTGTIEKLWVMTMELLQNLAFLHDYPTAMLLRQNAWDCAILRRFIGRMDLCTEGSAQQVWVVWHALKLTWRINDGSFNTWLHNKCMSESPVLFSTLWARVCHHGKMCIWSAYCSKEYHRSSFENLPGIIVSVCE